MRTKMITEVTDITLTASDGTSHEAELRVTRHVYRFKPSAPGRWPH